MLKRFEQFSTAVACIQRAILKIERNEMVKAGYKGVFAPCLVAMHHHPEGIDAASLAKLISKDKAAISRILSEMGRLGLITRGLDHPNIYRAKLFLTPKGKQAAQYVCGKAVLAVQIAGQGMPKEEWDAFYSRLSRIASNLMKLEKTGLPGGEA